MGEFIFTESGSVFAGGTAPGARPYRHRLRSDNGRAAQGRCVPAAHRTTELTGREAAPTAPDTIGSAV